MRYNIGVIVVVETDEASAFKTADALNALLNLEKLSDTTGFRDIPGEFVSVTVYNPEVVD